MSPSEHEELSRQVSERIKIKRDFSGRGFQTSILASPHFLNTVRFILLYFGVRYEMGAQLILYSIAPSPPLLASLPARRDSI